MTTREELPKKIAVLMGGPGSEREVSLATGRGVAKALRSLGAEVVEIDVRDENFQLPNDVDLAFITIHGTFGEDGQLQKILERRGIAYTGDGVERERDRLRQNSHEAKISGTRSNDSAVGSHSPRTAADDSVADRRQDAATRLNRRCRHREERKRTRIRHRRSVEI